MSRDPWTDDHSRLVAESAPPVAPPSEVEMERTWSRVATTVATGGPRRGPRRRLALGAVVAAALLGASGVAAAQSWSARTGELQTDAESIRLSGPGELIDPRGTDYEQVLREEIAGIPFPTDAAREVAVAAGVDEARQEARDMERARARGDEDWRSVEVTGGMRAEAARQAHCAWANAWAAATAASDATARDEATRRLDEARSWRAVLDVDAIQELRWKEQVVAGADGVARSETYLDNTPFAYLPLVARAAHGKDLRAVGRPLRRWTTCLPELMPDLPAAVPSRYRVH